MARLQGLRRQLPSHRRSPVNRISCFILQCILLFREHKHFGFKSAPAFLLPANDTNYTSFYAFSDFLTITKTSDLMLSRKSLVVLTGFQPIDLDLFARAREFLPISFELWDFYISHASNLVLARQLTPKYLTISSSVSIVGSGLSILPIVVRASPTALAIS